MPGCPVRKSELPSDKTKSLRGPGSKTSFRRIHESAEGLGRPHEGDGVDRFSLHLSFHTWTAFYADVFLSIEFIIL